MWFRGFPWKTGDAGESDRDLRLRIESGETKLVVLRGTSVSSPWSALAGQGILWGLSLHFNEFFNVFDFAQPTPQATRTELDGVEDVRNLLRADKVDGHVPRIAEGCAGKELVSG